MDNNVDSTIANAQFGIIALKELLVICEFGTLTEEMIRDQLVEK